MINEKIIVKVENERIEIDKGSTLKEISNLFQTNFKDPIILAKVDGNYKELSNTINKECNIEFVTYLDREGNRIYVNGLILLLIYSAKKVIRRHKLIVKHSLDKGIYIKTDKKITPIDVELIKKEMKESIRINLPIEKYNVTRTDAIDYFESIKENSKIDLLKYTTNTFVTLYKLGNVYDYLFSKMPIDTRCLEKFDLKYIDEYGFVLLYQSYGMKEGIKAYKHHQMIYDIYEDYYNWMKTIRAENVASLNNIVSSGKIGDLIRIEETIQSSKLLNIAREIFSNKSKIKIVLLAGPSSSGKTTTCNKLCMYLRSFGLNPKTLSMDNYFVERSSTPLDEFGKPNFECLQALNLKLFDEQVKQIVEGKEVRTPLFDFVAGKPNLQSGELIKLEKDDILLIEGIHALNPNLLKEIPRKNKYEIYLAPFNCMNLDDHNRISTTDNRLLRRIIRDNINRGHNVESTLDSWESVRRGEESNIFPYQDEADVIFNTALIYELGVLKTYVEPLLYSVSMNSTYYDDAKRLINTLKLFLPIPSEDIPKDSIIREFIGGGCFRQ
ncbi:MAG: nucleoside kinase [bacterium]|nr:nucleoside kinase [bacterium]